MFGAMGRRACQDPTRRECLFVKVKPETPLLQRGGPERPRSGEFPKLSIPQPSDKPCERDIGGGIAEHPKFSLPRSTHTEYGANPLRRCFFEQPSVSGVVCGALRPSARCARISGVAHDCDQVQPMGKGGTSQRTRASRRLPTDDNCQHGLPRTNQDRRQCLLIAGTNQERHSRKGLHEQVAHKMMPMIQISTFGGQVQGPPSATDRVVKKIMRKG